MSGPRPVFGLKTDWSPERRAAHKAKLVDELATAELDDASPLWTQDQAIAYEAARAAVVDVIAGYSAAIDAEQTKGEPYGAREAFLEMQTDHCFAVLRALRVTDDATVAQVLREYSAIVRARDGEDEANGGSWQELQGFFKGKTNGAALTIEEINDAIADAGALAAMAGLDGK